MKNTIKMRNINQPDVEFEKYFTCINCGMPVSLSVSGTRHRNHCPYCLWSKHVDIKPGDRAELCNGSMQPISLYRRDDNELSIIHRCSKCGKLKINRIAGDDDLTSMQMLAVKLMEDFAGK